MIALALACHLAAAPVMPEPPSEGRLSESVPSPEPRKSDFLSERPVFPAAVSLVVPGSGQLMQGRFQQGALQLGAASLLALLMVHGESQQANLTGAAGSGANVRTLSAVGLLGLAVWSPLDAWLFGANDPSSK